MYQFFLHCNRFDTFVHIKNHINQWLSSVEKPGQSLIECTSKSHCIDTKHFSRFFPSIFVVVQVFFECNFEFWMKPIWSFSIVRSLPPTIFWDFAQQNGSLIFFFFLSYAKNNKTTVDKNDELQLSIGLCEWVFVYRLISSYTEMPNLFFAFTISMKTQNDEFYQRLQGL